MITPSQYDVTGASPFGEYNPTYIDPLQVQFMAGGQMGGMAAQQYLTPYQFGAFRSMPMPNMNGYASGGSGIFSDWLVANRGGIFGLPAYTFNTYNPVVNARQQQAYAQRRLEDSRLSLASGMLGVGIDAGLATLGPVGWALSAMGVSDVVKGIDARRMSSREIQNLTTSKIFSGKDVAGDIGYGFSLNQARNLDRYIRAAAADDSVFKEGDYRDMLSVGLKYGQFDFANSAEEYKRIMKNMRGAMDTMMEVIQSPDFEEVMKDMKRMQDMGAKMSQYAGIARNEQQYARVLGMTHDQLVNTYGKQGAAIFQGAGLNAMQGSLLNQSMAAQATFLQRAGAINEVELAQHGGISGLAQGMTQEHARINNKFSSNMLMAFANEDFTGLREGLTFQDMMRISQDPVEFQKYLNDAMNRASANPQRARHNLNANRHKMMTSLQEVAGGAENVSLATAFLQGTLAGYSGEEAAMYGFDAMGVDAALGEQMLKAYRSGSGAELQKRALDEEKQKQKEAREQRNSLTSKIGRMLASGKNALGELFFGGGGLNGTLQSFRGDSRDSRGGGGGPSVSGTSLGRARAGATGGMTGSGRATGVGSLGNFDVAVLGSASSDFESGGKGAASVSYDNTGGTSYGRSQLSGAKGSFGEWVDMLAKGDDEKGREIARRLYAAKGNGSWDTGSAGGAVVDEYLKIVGEDKDYVERTQADYIKTKKYDPAFKGLESESLKNMISGNRALQEVLWSTAVQHGEAATNGGAAEIFNKVYREGMTADQLINAVYDERLKHFPHLEEKYRPGVVKRLNVDERNRMLRLNNIATGGTYGNGGTVNANEVGLDRAYSASIAGKTADAIRRGVKYDLGSKNSYEGQIDCSGWVSEAGLEMMDTMNIMSGEEIFDKATRDRFRKYGVNEGAAGLVRAASDEGRALLTGDQLSIENAREGLIIGLDTGKTGDRDGRFKEIDHVVMTFRDPATGKLMVSESRGGGKGVMISTYEDFYKHYSEKGAKFYGGDLMAQAKSPTGRQGIRGAGGLGVTSANLTAPSQAQYVEDTRRAAATAIDRQAQLYDKKITDKFGPITIETGYRYGEVMAGGNTIESARAIATAGKAEAAIASNLEYANEVIAGHGRIDEQLFDKIFKSNVGKIVKSDEYYLNSKESNSRWQKANGEWDYEKLADKNGYYGIALELAKAKGMSGEAAQKEAVRLMQDPIFMRMVRTQMHYKEYGGEDLKDREAAMLEQADLAEKLYGKEAAKAKAKSVASISAAISGGESVDRAALSDEERTQIENYRKLTQDTTSVEGSSYSRGEYFERLGLLSTSLGDLETTRRMMEGLEKSDLTKGGQDAKEMRALYENERKVAIGHLMSYGYSEEEAKQFLDSGKSAKELAGEAADRLNRSVKLNMQEDERKAITQNAESQARRADITLKNGGVGAEAGAREAFLNKKKTYEELAQTVDSTGIRYKDLQDETNVENVMDTLNWLSARGVSIDMVKNFHDKSKVNDTTANYLIKQAGLESQSVADLLKKTRSTGQALDITESVEAAYNAGALGSGTAFKTAEDRAKEGIDAANNAVVESLGGPINSQDAILGDYGEGNGNGGVSAKANAALEMMPPLFEKLNNTLSGLDGTIAVFNRKNQ